MKVLVLLNHAAGTLAASQTRDEMDRIREAFARLDAKADVRAVAPDRLAATARQALHEPYDAIIAGGGDGTLNAVASAMVGAAKPFGVLPLGTMNHFAREVGMPEDLEEAVAALVHGRPRETAVGEVNGQIFLNFSALGFYVDTIRHREAQRAVTGRHKWIAMAIALARQLRRFPLSAVTLRIDRQDIRRLTPSVFVCCNKFQLDSLGLSDLACSGRDQLNLYVARHRSRLAIIGSILRALLGRLGDTGEFETMCLPQLTIRMRRRQAHVSVDGEIITLNTPLHFQVCPGRLNVIFPPGNSG